MIKTRLAAFGISVLVVAASFMAASLASAHMVNSPYENIQTTPYTFSHTFPTKRADYTVGYKNGVWNITTNVQSKTANEWIQAWNYCYTGFGYIFVGSNAEWKTTTGLWVSAPSCGGAGLVQGAESVGS